MKRGLHYLGISALAAAALVQAVYYPAIAQTPANHASTQASGVSPDAVPSLAPADAPTSLPYPAYGTPVPGVREGVDTPGIPRIITLKQAVDVAVALSPTLASARADIGVNEAEVRLARAGYLPSLGATLGSNHSWYQNRTGVSNNVNGNVNVANTSANSYQTNSGSVSLSQLIFDGGRTAAGIRAAKDTETASADTYRRALQTVAYNVATAYYNTLAAERTTQIDIELVRENAVQLALVQGQFRAGTVAHVDVVTAEVPLAQARVSAVQALTPTRTCVPRTIRRSCKPATFTRFRFRRIWRLSIGPKNFVLI
jgi:outer membrane protein TolC